MTAFDFTSRDPSRSVLIGTMGVAATLIVGLFHFARVPADVDLGEQTSLRRPLPRELVRAALTRGLPEKEVGTVAPSIAPSEAHALGSLLLRTDPAVDVYDGNEHLGRTPLSAKVRTGSHKLRFTDRETGLNVYRTYRVSPGRETADAISFLTSDLIIEAPIGALVLLNSRPLGRAPLEPVTIYEGRYHVKVTHGTKTWADWFDAPPGRKIAYRVSLPVE